MVTSFFKESGNFYRGNLHTHSTRSDGALPPEDVCRRYCAEGYDFVVVTDHFVGLHDYPITDTSPYRTSKFTTLIGAELHTGTMDNGHLWHLLAVGLPSDFIPPDAPHFNSVKGSESAADLAQRARDAGAFVAIAHPHWSGMTEADARGITAAHAVEIYNHGCVVNNDRGEGFLTLEHLLNEGRHLNMIATDDAHFNTPDYFGGWVMVKAAENTPETLLEALKSGAYYSSTGPQIHDICIKDDHIEVACSPAVNVILQGRGTPMSYLHGEPKTSVKLPLDRLQGSPWIRVTIIDKARKRAWSNPIWVQD